jgi:Glycosyl transferase family 2
VNKPLKNKPIGGRFADIELHDRTSEQHYRNWVSTAQLYGRTLRRAQSGFPDTGQVNHDADRTLTLRIDDTHPAAIEEMLDGAYRALAPGDMLVVDFPTSPECGRGGARDLVSRTLFKAGFDRPLIWAGRQLLQAENTGVNRWLPPSALGAGPPLIPGVEGLLDVGPNQIVAVARCGALPPPTERPLRLSVVLPVYNEKKTFREVIELLLAKIIPGFEIEICLVESNSTDGTRDDVLNYAHHPRVRLLLEDKPSGKGHAVRQGLELATGDIILIQDADLEYDLADYEKLLDPIRNFETSFVLGSRHTGGKGDWQLRRFAEQRSMASVMNLGHIVFTWFLNVLFSQRLRDPFTMYKVFRRDCINNVPFECNRFDFDIELFGKLVRQGFKPIEIGVRYTSRSFYEGKKVSVFGDPPTWIRAGFRHRFSNLHVWPKRR